MLTRCECECDEEVDLYIELAARIGDDGESMGLAIAKCRGWSVQTDDKKARRIARELGVSVLGTTGVIKQWTQISSPSADDLSAFLKAIERLANDRPGRSAEDYDWWIASLK